MKLILMLLYCLSSVVHTHFQKRILGGSETVRYSFPNTVIVYSVRDNPRVRPIFCSGTIYNEDWILVTGLCVSIIGFGRPHQNIRVAAGKWNLSEVEPFQQIRTVIFTIIHNQFDTLAIGRSIDIGLLKLNQSLVFNLFLTAFPISKDLLYPTGYGVIVGWGPLTDEQLYDKKRSNIQNFLGVDIMTFTACKNAIMRILALNDQPSAKDDFDNVHFCTGTFINFGQGPVSDDTGGPFMKATPSGFEVVGLTSVGFISPNLGLYVQLSHFVDWIDTSIRRYNHII